MRSAGEQQPYEVRRVKGEKLKMLGSLTRIRLERRKVDITELLGRLRQSMGGSLSLAGFDDGSSDVRCSIDPTESGRP